MIFRKMWQYNLYTSGCLYDRSNFCSLYWNIWRCCNSSISCCRFKFRPNIPIKIVGTLSNIFRKMWWGNLHTSSCLYDRSNLCFLYWNLWRCSNVTFSSCRSDHISTYRLNKKITLILRQMWQHNLYSSSCMYDRSNFCRLHWDLWWCCNSPLCCSRLI